MGLDGPRSEGPGTSQGLDVPEDVSCLGRLVWPTFLLGVWLLVVDHLLIKNTLCTLLFNFLASFSFKKYIFY